MWETRWFCHCPNPNPAEGIWHNSEPERLLLSLSACFNPRFHRTSCSGRFGVQDNGIWQCWDFEQFCKAQAPMRPGGLPPQQPMHSFPQQGEPGFFLPGSAPGATYYPSKMRHLACPMVKVKCPVQLAVTGRSLALSRVQALALVRHRRAAAARPCVVYAVRIEKYF